MTDKLKKLMEKNGVQSLKKPDQGERLAKLEESNKALQKQNTMLQECLLEMSEIIYA